VWVFSPCTEVVTMKNQPRHSYFNGWKASGVNDDAR
jgi:hypothetical protein